MQEIEAKFYVRDPTRLRIRLQKLEARVIQNRTFETNLRFDLPDGTLRAERRVLRLRRDTESRLAYKGPADLDHGVLSRKEIEFVVGDFHTAKWFLEALGYTEILEYDKYRTTYQFGEGIHIMLDEMPYGNFIEIEGGDTKSIRAAAGTIGLDLQKIIAKSYTALFYQLKKNMNLSFTDLTFENFAGISVEPIDLGVEPADGNQDS